MHIHHLSHDSGHDASVSHVTFNAHGNLIVSGSKDGTIRFWDLLSGLCVRTLRQILGEVTSVQLSASGLYVLSGSKNNSNRLWDIRMSSRPTSGSMSGYVSSHTHTSSSSFSSLMSTIIVIDACLNQYLNRFEYM